MERRVPGYEVRVLGELKKVKRGNCEVEMKEGTMKSMMVMR